MHKSLLYLQIVFPYFVEDTGQQFIIFALSASAAHVTICHAIHGWSSKVVAIHTPPNTPTPALLLLLLLQPWVLMGEGHLVLLKGRPRGPLRGSKGPSGPRLALRHWGLLMGTERPSSLWGSPPILMGPQARLWPDVSQLLLLLQLLLPRTHTSLMLLLLRLLLPLQLLQSNRTAGLYPSVCCRVKWRPWGNPDCVCLLRPQHRIEAVAVGVGGHAGWLLAMPKAVTLKESMSAGHALLLWHSSCLLMLLLACMLEAGLKGNNRLPLGRGGKAGLRNERLSIGRQNRLDGSSSSRLGWSLGRWGWARGLLGGYLGFPGVIHRRGGRRDRGLIQRFWLLLLRLLRQLLRQLQAWNATEWARS